MTRWKVCSTRGCTQLVNTQNPCPNHSRPRNAPWSTGRDRQAQARFRQAVLAQDAFTCQRCGHHDPTGATLDAHHATPTAGQTLCNGQHGTPGCHALVDGKARTTR